MNNLLNTYPERFTVLEIHVGDTYATTWGNTRATFYGLYGTPTSWFDGVLECEGAYTNVQQMYNWYLQQITAREGVATDVTIELSAQEFASQSYRISARVGIEAGGTGKTMKVRMAQVIDHYPSSPNYSRNCLMQGTAGTVITVSPGQQGEVTADFVLNQTSWLNRQNAKIIVWAQQNLTSGPAEIYQAAVLDWPFVLQPGDMDCDGLVNSGDIPGFVLALTDPTGYEAAYPDCDRDLADVNQDGMVNAGDIPAFVARLTGG